MSVTASAVVNFSGAQNDTPLYIVTEPETVKVGDGFTVKLYAIEPFALFSPYNGIVGAKTVAAAAEQQIETIDLTGQSEFNTKYPVASLQSARVANAIVSDEIKQVIFTEGELLNEFLEVINGKIRFKTDFDMNFYGAVNLVYYTYPAQIWQHSSFSWPGTVVLYARNIRTGKWTPFQIRVTEDNVGLQIIIEGHDRTITINKYAIRMFPADADIKTFVSRGLLEDLPNQLIEKTETINLNFAESVKTQFEIHEFIEVSYDGSIFLDEDYNSVSVSVSLVNGELKPSKKVAGAVTVRYKTLARMFNYTPPNGNWVQFFGGAKMVAHSKPKKAFQIFDIPLPNAEFFDKTVVARVYRELVIADKRYEMPTTFQSGNISYASYPGADTSNLDTDYPKVEVNQVEIKWNGFNVNADEFQTPSWVFPTQAGTNFADIQWKIEEKIPPELEGSALQQVQDKIAEIKTKYGIL